MTTTRKVIGINTLNFTPNFKCSPLKFFGGPTTLFVVCASKPWPVSSACKNFRGQRSMGPKYSLLKGHQSSRRQAISATRVGQLGDNLFRLSVCCILIEQNKLSKKAVLSQGNHAMLLLISNMGYYLKQVAGHTKFLTQAPARKNNLE